MTVDSELFKIPDIITSRKELRSLKTEVNKKRLKFKSLLKEYDFVNDIVSPTIDDFLLESQVLKLFNNLGYKIQKPNTTRNVDGIVFLNGIKIGIEVKNSNLPEENELFQALKYCKRSEAKGEKMKPLIIWNNAKSNQNFDQFRIEDAINNEYGIITTRELLKGFMKVKRRKISLEIFECVIIRIGNISFSNKTILESGQGRV